MARLVLVLLVLASQTANAEALAGSTLTIHPDREEAVDDLLVGLWAAHAEGALYVGGEVAFETYTTSPDADYCYSYHALLGARAPLGERVQLAADVGAGLSQQIEVHLGILGGKSGSETESLDASGALRGHLAVDVVENDTMRLGLSLTTDARSTIDGDAGYGVGLGVFITQKPQSARPR